MLYIIDNGADYSDHAIYFVEVQPEEEPVLVLLLEALSLGLYKYKILLRTSSPEWHTGKSMRFFDFADNAFFGFVDKTVAVRLLKKLKEAWIQAGIQEQIPYNIMMLGE